MRSKAFAKPTTKAEFDRYMRCRLHFCGCDEWLSPHDILYKEDVGYYQLEEGGALIPIPSGTAFWIPIDPRFEYDQNRSPIRYKDEYRGEPETWSPVSASDLAL